MSLKVELLEQSFEAIKPQADDFVNSFYDNLFTANPEAQPLFASTDMAEQKKKLLNSLVLVVENLRMPEVLDQVLRGLGARHVKYGALPEHYPLVGTALLTTFEQYLGPQWTPEVKQAWLDAYGAITEIMLDGADYSEKEVALPSPEPEAASAEEVSLKLDGADYSEQEVTLPTPEPEAAKVEEVGLKVELLEQSFEAIKPQADDFVNSFYDNLFTAHPEAKPLFEGTNMAEQKKKLLNSLVLVVENLRMPEVLNQTLRGLGSRHVKYGALPEHYPLVGTALLTTFEQYLQEQWTPEVKQAWVDAYGAITEIMLDGADYSEKEVALPNPEPEAEEESALPTAESEASPVEEMGLKVELLEQSFEVIKPQAEEFVKSFYENLFTFHPEAAPFFAHTDMKEQKKRLLGYLVLIVVNLRKPEELDRALRGLGARHVKYGALPEHYPLVGSAFLTTFEQYLGPQWTPEVQQAWVEAYGTISQIMLDGADYSEEEIALPIPEPEAAPVEEVGLKVELLEQSFEAIKPQADEFVNSFYDNLFTAHPEAQPLFEGTNMAEQKKKLLNSLVLVVENLRMPEVLDQVLRGLGARHVKYGALPEHYPLVGSALLTTFEQYLGPQWTPEVKQAWVDAYGAITEIMLDGADYSEKEVALPTPEPEAAPVENEGLWFTIASGGFLGLFAFLLVLLY